MAYIFGGDTGKSYEDILREREIANALTERGLQSRNTGLGGAIEQIGTALIAKIKDRGVSKKEEGARSDAKEARERLLAALTGGASPSFAGPEISRSASGGVDMGNVSSAPLPSAESEGIGDAAMDAIGQPRQPRGVLGEAISRAASESGVSDTYLTRLAEVESGYGTNLANPNSSARGPFQFINSTAEQYGVNARDADFTDDALGAARFTRENQRQLEAQLGREASPGELYLAHQQGAGGAISLLSNPNARAVDIVGPEAVRLNGGDANMTAGQFANKWISKFESGGGGGMAAGGGGAPSMGGAQGMEYAMAIMDNPYASDADRALAGQFIQRTMQQPEGLTAWQKAQLGLRRQEMDMRRQGTWSPGTNVNVNTGSEGPQVGTIPQGFQLVQDPQSGGYRMDPIPGGPADTTANEAAKAEQSQRANMVVLEDIDRVQDKIENAPWYSPVTGAVGSMLSNVGGTAAFDTGALLRTIGGNIGFDRLQQMRDASPTGGALGAINQQELNLLMSVMGSLEQSQSEDQLLTNLDRLEGLYRNIMQKAAAYPNADEFGFGGGVGNDDDLSPDELQFLEGG